RRDAERPEAHAAVLLRHVGQPQTFLVRELAQPDDLRAPLGPVLGLLEHGRRRLDVLVDELADLGAQLEDVGRQTEIDRHGDPPVRPGFYRVLNRERARQRATVSAPNPTQPAIPPDTAQGFALRTPQINMPSATDPQ